MAEPGIALDRFVWDNPEQAAARLEALLASDRNNAEGWRLLGRALRRRSDLRDVQNAIKGTFPDYTNADFSIGADNGRYRVELFATNLFDSNGRYSTSIQCQETVCGDPDGLSGTGGVFCDYVIKPRTVGIKIGADF